MWKKMLTNSRTHLFLLIAIALLGLTGCHSNQAIVHGLDERDANEILVLLAENNIPAHKVEQTASLGGGGGPKIVLWDVTVSSENVEQAMHFLNANGLARRSSQNLLTLFSATGVVLSEMAEKIRYRVGLADTIANLLCSVDGIVDADVELSYPKQDVLEPTAKLAPITASVFVKHTGVLD